MPTIPVSDCIQLFRDALHQSDPLALARMAECVRSYDGLLVFRDELAREPFSQKDKRLLAAWVWHDDSGIADIARKLALLSTNITILEAIFQRVHDEGLSNPYDVKYDSAEGDFHIDYNGIPGIGLGPAFKGTLVDILRSLTTPRSLLG